jgi:hypothetical protein
MAALTDQEIVTRLRGLAAEIEARGAAPEHPATPASTEPPPPATAQPGPAPLAWGAKVSPIFRDRVRWIAEDLDIGPTPGKPEPNWPMTWMAFETGRTFSPTVKNPGSSATGLLQFMQDTAVNDLNTTLDHLRSLSAEDQLNFAWRYLRNRIRERGPIRSLSDGYMSILLPSAMGKPESAVLWPKGTKAYFANRGLDANADGTITKAEAAAKIYATLAEGLKPENAA